MADSPSAMFEGKGKFRAYNRKKLSVGKLKKLAPVQLSKYMAYEEPPRPVLEAQKQTMRRLLELRNELLSSQQEIAKEEELEREKHAKLIGQLKAAEARNRLRIMRLRYQANRAQEIGHLIACQPVALKAVRLEALLPPMPDVVDKGDFMDRLDRMRVESLIEDKYGLLTIRSY